jgi:hypothetical protein
MAGSLGVVVAADEEPGVPAGRDSAQLALRRIMPRPGICRVGAGRGVCATGGGATEEMEAFTDAA